MLTLLPTPIGNLEDITFRALRALEEAETILCEDTRVAKKLLHLLSERYSLNFRVCQYISLHSHNEEEFLKALDPSFFEKHVVYMSDAGMPAISDPGAALVRYCQEHAIAYTVLPGPTAFATAYAASGFLWPKFSFFGFLPHKGAAREEMLQRLLSASEPVVLYESPHRLEKLLEELATKAPDREIFAAKELSKQHERYFRGKAKELLSQIHGPLRKGEWVIVISADECSRKGSPITVEDVMVLKTPPKQKAKLLAKMTGDSVSYWYEKLVDGDIGDRDR